jgi:Family of unknown function (DUF5995)
MSIDDALRDLLATGPAADTSAVIARLRAIDALLPDDDGLKWFNTLYRMVTEAVLGELSTGGWADLDWITELDVDFANLYFDALTRGLSAEPSAPHAWQPLLEGRHRRGVAEIQFALSGMNAHINRDLAVAVVTCCARRGIAPVTGSPQFRDYTRIDAILSAVEVPAVALIARGPVSVMARALGNLDDIFAMWSIRQARRAAWTSAEVLWALRGTALGEDFLTVLDRKVGFAGCGLLLRTTPITP